MRRLMLAIVLIASSVLSSNAQCVIYADNKLGVFGAGYNKYDKPTTWEQCEEDALKDCVSRGGINCVLVKKIEKPGWCAIIKGKTKDGRHLFQGADGVSSQLRAEREARDRYRKAGGVDPMGARVFSWHVYGPPKRP